MQAAINLLEDRGEEGVIRLGAQLEGGHKGGLLLQAVATQLTGPLVQHLLLIQLCPGLQV